MQERTEDYGKEICIAFAITVLAAVLIALFVWAASPNEIVGVVKKIKIGEGELFSYVYIEFEDGRIRRFGGTGYIKLIEIGKKYRIYHHMRNITKLDRIEEGKHDELYPDKR